MQRRTVAGIIVAAAGAAYAWQRAWICDDATISFRYAQNLVDGHGLVFNPGEAVEGYTNFLWTLGLSAAMGLGIAPETAAHMGSISAFFLTILLLARAGAGPIPMAAAAFAGFSAAADFATSGLETSLFTLLLTATALAGERADTTRRALGAGVLASLALLTRPEGGLVGVMLVGALALSGQGAGERGARRAGAAALPLALTALVWGAWKLSFYGSLLPNTWYAKAGEGARWEQGLIYVSQYLRTSWPVALGLLAGPLALLEPGPRAERARSLLLLWALPAMYLLHVVRVGGDFMFGRFCLPITPLLLLGLERALAARLPTRASLALGLALPLASLLALSPQALERARSGGILKDGVIDERAYYTEREQAILHQIDVLRPMLTGLDVRVAFFGAQARLVFALALPYALEGEVGLTDAEIARLPSPPGSRIGHGPRLTLRRAVERNIDLFIDRPPEPGDQVIARIANPSPTERAAARVLFDPEVSGWLLSWRPELVAALSARGARISPIEVSSPPAR